MTRWFHGCIGLFEPLWNDYVWNSLLTVIFFFNWLEDMCDFFHPRCRCIRSIRMTCFSRLRGMQKKQCSPENIISFWTGIVSDVLAPGEGNWRWVCTGCEFLEEPWHQPQRLGQGLCYVREGILSIPIL